MGLAASQARMLMLFARKSDLEFRGQTINQRRLAIAYQQADYAQDLTQSLSNRTLNVKIAGTELPIDTGNLSLAGFRVYTFIDGVRKEISSSVKPTTGADPSYIYDQSAEDIEEGLRNGNMFIEKQIPDPDDNSKVKWISADWTTNTSFEDSLDTSDDNMAQAHYDSQMALVQAQDKMLEIELKNVETQHSAVQTEIEAVKKVIDKNIETSFKTFG